METIELQIDNAPNFRFIGEQIAQVSSETESSQRWTVLTLYRTQAGKFVGYKEGCSSMPGERLKSGGMVADTEAQVIEFFKQGPLAKKLYAAAKIENVLVVD